MDEDTLRVIVKAILHEAVEHTARLNREDELRVCVDELDLLLLHVIRNRVARIPDVIAAVIRLGSPPRVISSSVRFPITLAPLSSGRSLKSSRRSCVMTSRSSARRFDSSCAWNLAMSQPSEM